MQTRALRYFAGFVAGLAGTVASWGWIATAHPIFAQLAPSGLIPPVVAGVVGGFLAGFFAPRHKILFAYLIGAVLTAALLGLMAVYQMDAFGRNPFLWYWPAYLAPSFLLGGVLSRGMWQGAA